MPSPTIYTRLGDDGLTDCADGRRLPKDHPVIEAVGTIDELSCHVGLLAAMLTAAPGAGLTALPAELIDIQRCLAALGARLSGVASPCHFPGRDHIDSLERAIDAAPAFRGFVVPGGHPTAAQAHVCRAVCRRAERRAITADCPAIVPYLNRLSDYFFALSRKLNHFYTVDENKL